MKEPFEKVVAAHGATVLRVCRVVVGVHDADDAWSETFLAALRHYPDLPDDANVEAWLVTIAHRKSVDIVRAQQRHARLVGTVPESPVADADAPDLDLVDSGGGAHSDHLWAAVGSLPTKQRQAVAYHHLAGLPYAEVAEILGGSVAAARRAASDGIRSLRRTVTRAPTSGGP